MVLWRGDAPSRMGGAWSTLLFRMMLPVLLALIPGLAMLVWNAVESRSLAADRARSEARQMVDGADREVERSLEATGQFLQTLARLREIRQADPAEVRELLAGFLEERPLYSNLGLAASGGALVATAVPGTGGTSVADRPWFRRAMERNRLSVGEFEREPATGKAVLNLGYPVPREGGKPGAVVFASVDLERANNTVTGQGLPKGSVLLITDRRGALLLRHPHSTEMLGDRIPEDVLQAVLHDERGSTTLTGPDGVERLFVFSRLRPRSVGASGYLAVGTPTGLVYAPANAFLLRNLLILMAVAALSLGVAWSVGEFLFVRRLRLLSRVARRLGRMHLSARTGLPHDGDEIGALAGALDDMAERLEHLTQRHDEAHARVLQVEREKKWFNREVLRVVTGGRFHLVERDEIPTPGRPVLEMDLESPGGYSEARSRLRALCHEAELDEDRAEELVLAFGEAATNAIKHARGGLCQAFRTGDSIVVRVSDRGEGIRAEDLPATLFESGFSTKVSLGMGYTLMLRLADTIWLSTGASGTAVQIEKCRSAAHTEQDSLMALLDRF